jgi:hypothetical protein
MQNMSPADYAGNRVKMTAWIKSEGVEDWAGMWLRVDGESKSATAFDNMGDRPIKGTTEWTQYSIVLNVHPKATNIAYGVLVSDAGTVWIDDVQFELVGEKEPTTGSSSQFAPQNPSFEE